MRDRFAKVVVVLLMAIGIAWCVGLATVRLNLPDLTGSVFAVEIVDCKIADEEQCYWSTETAEALLGPPPDKIRDGEYDYVPVGKDGFVVARMGSLFADGDDTDLRVYAAPHQGYGLYNVSISVDAESWIEVAHRVKSDNTNTWYRSIDFAGVEGQFEYVRIDAAAGGGCTPYILAIEAVHPCEAPPPAQAPTARFAYSPSEATVGDPVTFDARSSTDADGDIRSHVWSFGDGASGTGQTVTHTFASSGTFTVRLEVTDTDGLSSSTTHQVHVTEAQSPPTADFFYHAAGASVEDAPGPFLPGELILFDASSSTDPDGRILEYAWDWDGDSQFEELSHQPTAEHAFDTPGMYPVTLRVIDSSGLLGFMTKTIEVAEPEASDQVPVSFLSTPDGADVDIDGYFVGNTPLELMLDLGAVYEVRISLSGYNEWVRMIKVFEGLVINVRLASGGG